MEYNIYCDESCHLENDTHDIMVLGAVWCPTAHAPVASKQLRLLKESFGLSKSFELKWTKMSPAKLNYYLAVLEYFYANPNLYFRALVASQKQSLDHDRFLQDHDTWYYKIYYDLLKIIIVKPNRFSVYVDYKDTRGGKKVAKLHEILSSALYDFENRTIDRIQIVRSHEVELLQVSDLLLGAVSHANRPRPESSHAKSSFISRMRELSGQGLLHSTPIDERKTNIFRWTPKNNDGRM